MRAFGIRVWALVASVAAFLFGAGSPAKGGSPVGGEAVPSVKEPAVRETPPVPAATLPSVRGPAPRMKSQMNPSLFAPPEAVVTVISYGATHAGMGLDRKTFSVRGPWAFTPDGSLRQKDKLGRVMIVKESGEVIIRDASGRQVEKRQDTAAMQFYRVMKRAEGLRLQQGP